MSKRPGYFYTQSGVIPIRKRRGKLELLMVTSTNKKRWVIPKGVKEPHLSPRKSAIKEAWEVPKGSRSRTCLQESQPSRKPGRKQASAARYPSLLSGPTVTASGAESAPSKCMSWRSARSSGTGKKVFATGAGSPTARHCAASRARTCSASCVNYPISSEHHPAST